MIIGVGIDIVEVERIAGKVDSAEEFIKKVFSEREIAFCESQYNSGQHYAARFAAKEAFLKATGMGLTLGYDLRDIEVVNDEIGKPSLNLKGTFAARASENNWNRIHVSMTHVKSVASAVVIIEE